MLCTVPKYCDPVVAVRGRSESRDRPRLQLAASQRVDGTSQTAVAGRHKVIGQGTVL